MPPPPPSLASPQIRPGRNPSFGDSPPEGGGRHVQDAREGAVPAVQRGGDECAPRAVPPPGAVRGLRGAGGQLPGVRRADRRRGGEDVQHLTRHSVARPGWKRSAVGGIDWSRDGGLEIVFYGGGWFDLGCCRHGLDVCRLVSVRKGLDRDFGGVGCWSFRRILVIFCLFHARGHFDGVLAALLLLWVGYVCLLAVLCRWAKPSFAF